MLDRTTTPADELLSRITMAVALANDAEKKIEGAKADYVSRGRAVGVHFKLIFQSRSVQTGR